ncbi:MAG: type II secretion system GspH family protein [Candidatus Saccharibacteria bacterium]|nr:type II secretion system GspH family protein [Candidatus Saccharibacteria bacterium]
MIKTNTNSKKGFTIIEVVLVLAIAGLIFLMVFLALPAMQASQRDTQRRNDLSLFASQLTQYSANNRGKVPGTTEAEKTKWEEFLASYLSKLEKNSDGIDWKSEENQFVDPDGQPYLVQWENSLDNGSTATPPVELDHIIHVYTYAECDGESVVKSTGARKVAFQYKLEGSGVYCGHN